MNNGKILMALVTMLALAACGPAEHESTTPTAPESAAIAEVEAPAPQREEPINPDNWPLQSPPIERDPAMEQKISDLISRMSVEQKVGQVIQPDIASVTPEQVRQYHIGSVLNGGGSAPEGDLRIEPQAWLDLADAFWDASTDTSYGGLGIPAIWGTDAVHGHSNIVGATIFPHNIGLGAMNDPDLMYEIGRITALEMLTTGLDWTFAPTIAVVRNDRWGRTYEGYSEDPRIVAAYAPRIVEGLQGRLGSEEFLDEDRIFATAKHFVGDGGTIDGKDQGENDYSEADFRDIHAAGYPPAIAAGVQTVMASYNSYHGRKMHGYKEMLSDVLVGRMGLDGFVVGDWNGHGQVEGCTNDSCPISFNAGLDMFMAPDSWEPLYHNTLAQVKSGEISMQRLDQAVARILRVKFRAGVFDQVRPSERKNAGNWDLLGAPEHRAVAREAVRKSLVLLKNEGGLLPLDPTANLLVTGDGADDIGKQCGGWTLSWQGTGNTNDHFPNGQSIFAGIAEAAEAAGGRAILSGDGSYEERPDVAIVVFGEDPYAEFQGDRPSVDFDDDRGLNLLRQFAEAGIPTVSVFISGRPMWVNPELNASTAFVAAWLPGSEGGGIADVLLADASGQPRHDFTGRLSFSWPRLATDAKVNVGEAGYDPLFAYGFGLSYADNGSLAMLPEDSGLSGVDTSNTGRFIEYGSPVAPWALNLRDDAGNAVITDVRGRSPAGAVTVVPLDDQAQEDTMLVTWVGKGSLVLDGQPVNLQRETNGDLVLEVRYRVLEPSSGAVSFSMGRGVDWRGSLDVTSAVNAASGQDWRVSRIRMACFDDAGALMESITEPFMISAEAGLKLQINTARLAANPGNASCEP